MKLKISAYTLGALMLGGALCACDDDFERPPMILPEGNDIAPNALLGSFKDEFWADAQNSPIHIGFWSASGEQDGMTHEAGDSIIFVGRVCSSDESGNIYKNIVIQNLAENPEDQVAMTFAVNQTKMYQTYRYGAEVVVYASDLYLGSYSGLLQFGSPNGNNMTFMDATVFSQHVQLRSGLPDPSKVLVSETTLDELKAAKNDQEQLRKWQSRLVKINDVHFANPGLPFAGDATTNRDLLDAGGNKIIVRTSAYASFARELLPAGTGSVTGILSWFGSDWQILLIDADGCEGFQPSDTPDQPDTPVVPGDAVTELDQNFDASTDIPAGWTNVQTAGEKKWYVTTFNNNNYAAMTGYKGTAPFDSWLITPAIDIEKASQKVASFRTQVNGYGSKTTTFKVFALDNADPSKANKTELKPQLPTAPESGYSSWVESGSLDLSAFKGVIWLAFEYAATQDDNYATWCVDNVVVGKQGSTTPDTPDTPATGALYTLLPSSATELPAGWTFENVDLGGLESIWKWEVYNENGYIKGTAYKNGAVAATSYAVSPEIDLTGATGCYLTFMSAARFQTTLRTMCGVCARVVGTTEWTDLSIPSWPEAGTWTFASSGNVDLKAFDGKKIQIAFKYGSSSEGADTWEVNNLNIFGTK